MDFPFLLTAMITPFNENGEVDLAAAELLADNLLEQGSTGIVVAGTTGEAPTLSDKEKLDLFKTVRQAVGNRGQVWAGTGFNNTHHSAEVSKLAEKAGVDGLLTVVPYYNKPSQEGLYQHFSYIAQNTALPIMLYNIPSRTGINMLPPTVARLAEHKNIVALKESAGNFEQMGILKQILPENFAIYSGDDALTLPMMALGAQGVVSVASHLVGSDIYKMIKDFREGRVQEALAIHLKLQDLFKVLFITSNPVPLKAALQLLGRDSGQVRLPLAPCNEGEIEQIRSVLKNLGML